MGKSKIRVKVLSKKGKNGIVIATMPVSAKVSSGKEGKMLFQTKAIVSLNPKTDQHGKPRN